MGTLAFPLVVGAITLTRARRWHFLLLGTFAVALTYNLYIGGDAAPSNRFLLPVAPALMVLAAQGIHRAMAAAMECKTHLAGTVVRSAATLLGVVTLNMIHWDHCVLLARPQGTQAAHVNLLYVHALDKTAAPDATVAVGWAGTFPYFSGRRCFDLLGKCDPDVARLPARSDIARAAHNKYNFGYTSAKHRPDVVLHWTDSTDQGVLQDYHPVAVPVDKWNVVFCVRNHSRKIKGAQPVDWETFRRSQTRNP